jgi:ABC-type branched-subunit amino acid transport system ATPase component
VGIIGRNGLDESTFLQRICGTLPLIHGAIVSGEYAQGKTYANAELFEC